MVGEPRSSVSLGVNMERFIDPSTAYDTCLCLSAFFLPLQHTYAAHRDSSTHKQSCMQIGPDLEDCIIPGCHTANEIESFLHFHIHTKKDEFPKVQKAYGLLQEGKGFYGL